MSLYDDANTELANRMNNTTFMSGGNTFYVTDFIYNAIYVGLYNACQQEIAASPRALVLANVVPPLASNSGNILALIRQAYNLLQQLNDGYQAITNQITAGTITSTMQIIPAWNTFDSTYVNTRVLAPSNEALNTAINALATTVAGLSTATRTQSAVSRTLNAAFQPSASQDVLGHYSFSISCSLSLTGGSAGNIAVQIANNSSMTGAETVAVLSASNTGSLTIGLNTVQISPATCAVEIPKTWYCKFVTTNTTGTPTFSYTGGQEVLI